MRRRGTAAAICVLLAVAFVSLGLTRKIGTIIGMPFGLAMSLDYLPVWSQVYKFGRNDDVDTGGVPATAWNCPAIVSGIPDAYIYESASPLFVWLSSDDDSDAGLTVMVEGLGSEWELQSNEVTLGVPTGGGGTTMARTDNTFWRTFRVYNTSDTDLSGNVYASITLVDIAGDGIPDVPTSVRACIPVGRGQTLQATYTIPAGHTGHLVKLCMGVSAASAPSVELASLQFVARLEDSVFRTRDEWGLTSRGTAVDCRTFFSPYSFPEKTDLEIRALTVGGDNTQIHGDFTIWLEENS